MMTLKVLAALLTYPTEKLVAALPDLHAVIADEAMLRTQERRGLRAFMQALGEEDIFDLQERYVDTFDRGRATSLHLFEHVHGESRDRGQAMVDLAQVYESAGYHLRGGELPDFLPAMLEFASERPEADARAMLHECAHILAAVGHALDIRRSPYLAVFEALLGWLGLRSAAFEAGQDAPEADEPSLDELWAEAPAFPGGTASCSAAASGRACSDRDRVAMPPTRRSRHA
ncbi:MAG: nitrate reductase molybdenum cofactor assembly chaperone [Betaproteobacteria bacterium]|nr:nitrate reductase molybdenum cofactor assembly chaperone [Betaproteobacteria bacterium]